MNIVWNENKTVGIALNFPDNSDKHEGFYFVETSS